MNYYISKLVTIAIGGFGLIMTLTSCSNTHKSFQCTEGQKITNANSQTVSLINCVEYSPSKNDVNNAAAGAAGVAA
ncbi:MAG: hypothetical protein KAG45_02040 [Methyloprofundus sp.]|nr:hypothetical protein [Methyloprofundus sp.]